MRRCVRTGESLGYIGLCRGGKGEGRLCQIVNARRDFAMGVFLA